MDEDTETDMDTDTHSDMDTNKDTQIEFYPRAISDDFSNVPLSQRDIFPVSNGQFRTHLIQFREI
jgi:hypothetical protein